MSFTELTYRLLLHRSHILNERRVQPRPLRRRVGPGRAPGGVVGFVHETAMNDVHGEPDATGCGFKMAQWSKYVLNRRCYKLI